FTLLRNSGSLVGSSVMTGGFLSASKATSRLPVPRHKPAARIRMVKCLMLLSCRLLRAAMTYRRSPRARRSRIIPAPPSSAGASRGTSGPGRLTLHAGEVVHPGGRHVERRTTTESAACAAKRIEVDIRATAHQRIRLSAVYRHWSILAEPVADIVF